MFRPFLATLATLTTLGAASAQLAPPTTLAVGSNPEGVAVAPLTGTADLDLAVAVDGPDRVAIRAGNGDGTFGAPMNVLTGGGSSPHSIAASDFDGDGDTDLAVTLKNIGQVRILVNQAGSFVNGASIGAGIEPRRMIAAQLTTDDRADLIAVDGDNNLVTVLLNNGSGAFGATTFGVGGDPRDVAAADVDGDLDNDLIVSAHDDRRLELYLNDGDGGFTAGGTLSLGAQLRPEGVVGRDIDGDGDTDILAAASGNAQNVVVTFLNNGGFGGFTTSNVGALDPSFLLASDLDDDGDADFLTVNNDGNSISVLTNNGGVLGAPTVIAVGAGPSQAAAGDVDGSGTPDVFVTNSDAGSTSQLMNQLSASVFADLGGSLSGATTPQQEGLGSFTVGSQLTWALSNALPNRSTAFVLGVSVLDAPFKGGTMVPTPDVIITGLPIDGAGNLAISIVVPALPSGLQLVTQFWISDAAGPVGFSASNGLVATVP